MDAQVVKARLKADPHGGWRVLCGRMSSAGAYNCYQDIGRIDRDLGSVRDQRSFTDRPVAYAVTLGPGWVRDPAGCWRLSRHADRRRRKGQGPTHRRGIRISGTGETRQAWSRATLPTVVYCPYCDAPNELMPSLLRGLTDRCPDT